MKKKTLKKYKIKLKAFNGSPQKSGTCTKVFTGTPKKPNSALRKLTKIILTKGKTLIAHIPGEGHNLQKFSTVLCRGSRVRDTPGIKYRVIRGVKKYHLKGILARVRGRSKYGTKKFSKKI
jgi:small subunit ribosomal protein S12